MGNADFLNVRCKSKILNGKYVDLNHVKNKWKKAWKEVHENINSYLAIGLWIFFFTFFTMFPIFYNKNILVFKLEK